MVKSLNAGVAGLKAHQQMMDVIGNNIANVNTFGYKGGSMAFQDAIYQSVKSSQTGNTANGGYGGQNPSQVGYGVTISGISYDFGQGGASATGRPLDCMIEGSGFFIVGTYNGTKVTEAALPNSGLHLSRVGRFFVDNNGFLVDGNANYVYGFPATATKDADGNVTFPVDRDNGVTPLQIPIIPGSSPAERYSIESFSIKEDGTLVGTTDDNKTVTIGQVALAAVGNPNGMTKSSSYYYDMSDNCGAIGINAPGGATGRLISECLEMAKVDLSNEFAQMIITQRGFQANTKIITVTDQMLEEMVNMKR